MADVNLRNVKRVHCIGIGGIGISAIAWMMLMEGKQVSGSDRDESKVTEELRRAGATITIGQKAENIPEECDLVIYTVAIPADNPELVRAKERGIPLMTYPETLDQISKEKYTIAVSGTHGKTTTTAMIAKVLIDAGLDPTVIVGSLMKLPDGRESNYIAGRSQYLVVEADEYKKSFHNLHPTMLVINNLDLDHLDFYKDLADIQDSFRTVALKVPAGGYVITDLQNKNITPAIQGVVADIVDYKPYMLDMPALKVPGEHNRSNAAVALAVAEALGVVPAKAILSLEAFESPWRRFEFKGKMEHGALVYDDYAHNPHKIRAALQGAREAFPHHHIVCVFQPHLFSRTKSLLGEFATAFDDANTVLLTPIYPAREVFDPTISSVMLADAIRVRRGQAEAFDSLAEIEKVLKEKFDTDKNLIVLMGAGDINTMAGGLVRARE